MSTPAQVNNGVSGSHSSFTARVKTKERRRDGNVRRRFSPEEDQKILENLRSFMELHNIPNVNELLGFNMGRGAKNKFRRESNFCEHIAQNLGDRSVGSLYRRARELVNPSIEKGKYSVEELEKVLALRKRFGNKWMKIKAVHENRGYYSVYNAMRTLWTPEDERRLIRALRKVVGKERMSLPMFDLPWLDIVKFMPLKTAAECKRYWKRVLYEKWKYWPPRFPKANRACLIYMMHSNIVRREEFVDWDAVFQAFRSYVPTYSTLRMHWDDLKYLVPNHAQRDHEDIVLYLYYMHLPKLLEKCGLQLSDIERMCKLREFKKPIES